MLNRLSKATDWLGGITTYAYDVTGNLVQTTNPNATTTVYTYDIAGRTVSLSNAKADHSLINSYSLTLDGVGNHTQSTQNEPLRLLVPAHTTTFAYDNDNRLASFTGTSNTYDANGNLTAKETDTYAYDFENRLIQSTIASAVSQYQYDGAGNRKSTNLGGATKRFVLDTNGTLSRVLAETDGSGVVTAYYVYGKGLISRVTPTGTPANYHYDIRGSTIALSSSSGILTDQYVYDPFGKLTNSQGVTTNPYKYVGKYGVMDEGNGLDYIRARYFSPEAGRFITKDLLTGTDGDSQSLHRYVYALNNPVHLVDMSGFTAIDILADQATVGTNVFSKLTYKALAIDWSANPVSYAGTGSARDASQDGGKQFDLHKNFEMEYANAYWWINLIHPFASDSEKDRMTYEKLDERRKSQEVVMQHDNDMNESGSTWNDLGNPNVVTAHWRLGLSSPDLGIRIAFQTLGVIGGINQIIGGTPTTPEEIEVKSYKAQTYKK